MVRILQAGPAAKAFEASHGGHGHSHDVAENAGLYVERDVPVSRKDWHRRAFTVGIGGPVGSGKTATVLALCEYLRDQVGLVVVTNDIFTNEDWEFLCENAALEKPRMLAVQTGGCPHAAIREDVSANLAAVKKLTADHSPQIAIVESGGDNLAANFSRELADFIVYVIDVAGGDKVPRKGGPGVTQSDVLVINKIDLATAVGASLDVMRHDAEVMRDGGPTIFAEVKRGIGIPELAEMIAEAYRESTGEPLNISLRQGV